MQSAFKRSTGTRVDETKRDLQVAIESETEDFFSAKQKVFP